MGLLEELIVLVKETIEEARERNEPARPVASRDPEEIEVLRQRMAQRAAEERRAEQVAEEREEHERIIQDRQRQVRDRERHYLKQAKAVEAAQVTRHVGAKDPRHLIRLLHQPQALRDLVVLREILDRPLALRSR